MTLAPPGLTRTAPETPKHLVEPRLRVIDKRRAEIEVTLASLAGIDGNSYKFQKLESELAALNHMRLECESILHPAAKPARHPGLEAAYARQRERDRRLLRDTIRQQTEQIEADAARNRLPAITAKLAFCEWKFPIAERICKEFGKDPTLPSEIKDGNHG